MSKFFDSPKKKLKFILVIHTLGPCGTVEWEENSYDMNSPMNIIHSIYSAEPI